jgi:hypothetical protein
MRRRWGSVGGQPRLAARRSRGQDRTRAPDVVEAAGTGGGYRGGVTPVGDDARIGRRLPG